MARGSKTSAAAAAAGAAAPTAVAPAASPAAAGVVTAGGGAASGAGSVGSGAGSSNVTATVAVLGQGWEAAIAQVDEVHLVEGVNWLLRHLTPKLGDDGKWTPACMPALLNTSNWEALVCALRHPSAGKCNLAGKHVQRLVESIGAVAESAFTPSASKDVLTNASAVLWYGAAVVAMLGCTEEASFVRGQEPVGLGWLKWDSLAHLLKCLSRAVYAATPAQLLAYEGQFRIQGNQPGALILLTGAALQVASGMMVQQSRSRKSFQMAVQDAFEALLLLRYTFTRFTSEQLKQQTAQLVSTVDSMLFSALLDTVEPTDIEGGFQHVGLVVHHALQATDVDMESKEDATTGKPSKKARGAYVRPVLSYYRAFFAKLSELAHASPVAELRQAALAFMPVYLTAAVRKLSSSVASTATAAAPAPTGQTAPADGDDAAATQGRGTKRRDRPSATSIAVPFGTFLELLLIAVPASVWPQFGIAGLEGVTATSVSRVNAAQYWYAVAQLVDVVNAESIYRINEDPAPSPQFACLQALVRAVLLQLSTQCADGSEDAWSVMECSVRIANVCLDLNPQLLREELNAFSSAILTATSAAPVAEPLLFKPANAWFQCMIETFARLRQLDELMPTFGQLFVDWSRRSTSSDQDGRIWHVATQTLLSQSLLGTLGTAFKQMPQGQVARVWRALTDMVVSVTSLSAEQTTLSAAAAALRGRAATAAAPGLLSQCLGLSGAKQTASVLVAGSLHGAVAVLCVFLRHLELAQHLVDILDEQLAVYSTKVIAPLWRIAQQLVEAFGTTVPAPNRVAQMLLFCDAVLLMTEQVTDLAVDRRLGTLGSERWSIAEPARLGVCAWPASEHVGDGAADCADVASLVRTLVGASPTSSLLAQDVTSLKASLWVSCQRSAFQRIRLLPMLECTADSDDSRRQGLLRVLGRLVLEFAIDCGIPDAQASSWQVAVAAIGAISETAPKEVLKRLWTSLFATQAPVWVVQARNAILADSAFYTSERLLSSGVTALVSEISSNFEALCAGTDTEASLVKQLQLVAALPMFPDDKAKSMVQLWQRIATGFSDGTCGIDRVHTFIALETCGSKLLMLVPQRVAPNMCQGLSSSYLACTNILDALVSLDGESSTISELCAVWERRVEALCLACSSDDAPGVWAQFTEWAQQACAAFAAKPSSVAGSGTAVACIATCAALDAANRISGAVSEAKHTFVSAAQQLLVAMVAHDSLLQLPAAMPKWSGAPVWASLCGSCTYRIAGQLTAHIVSTNKARAAASQPVINACSALVTKAVQQFSGGASLSASNALSRSAFCSGVTMFLKAVAHCLPALTTLTADTVLPAWDIISMAVAIDVGSSCGLLPWRHEPLHRMLGAQMGMEPLQEVLRLVGRRANAAMMESVLRSTLTHLANDVSEAEGGQGITGITARFILLRQVIAGAGEQSFNQVKDVISMHACELSSAGTSALSSVIAGGTAPAVCHKLTSLLLETLATLASHPRMVRLSTRDVSFMFQSLSTVAAAVQSLRPQGLPGLSALAVRSHHVQASTPDGDISMAEPETGVPVVAFSEAYVSACRLLYALIKFHDQSADNLAAAVSRSVQVLISLPFHQAAYGLQLPVESIHKLDRVLEEFVPKASVYRPHLVHVLVEYIQRSTNDTLSRTLRQALKHSAFLLIDCMTSVELQQVHMALSRSAASRALLKSLHKEYLHSHKFTGKV